MRLCDDGERPLFHLAAAIERGDLSDTWYWLDRLCSTSSGAQNEIALGRFSPEAKRAA